ncbi:MAG: carboxypeptidase regulatory-like domain-containing protein [Acidobacteriia bacterium]|nr:carboxypeptidase regulatory-like domain-containing protein [Terriglobia bacterium]
MNRKLRDKLILVATCLALCIPSFGQVLKGSISGTAVDQQGAVVSGAQVKATNVATGTALATTTDNSGSFRFNLIPAGTYKIEVSAQGFKTVQQNDILVVAGQDRGLGALKLSVGEASTTIEVAATAPLIETTQAQVTNTFSGTTLTTFAGIQENQGLDNLALFVPGVVSVRDNGFSNTNGGQGFSSNGLRGRNNDQQIDGQNNNDNSVGGPGLFVSDTEFVQQYVLVTNNFGPEYGRNAGSVVNIITKSGGNAWHGSVYESENNSILNSLNNSQRQGFITDAAGNNLTEQPRLNDEFGGFTVGGPIVKNKVFFFGGFDQELISTKSIFQSSGFAPTPAGLAQLAACAPGSTGLAAYNKVGPYSISAGNPTPVGNTPVDVSPACLGIDFAQVQRIVQTPFHGFNFTNRVDYQRGNDNFMARYLFNRGNNFNIDFGDGAAGYPVSVPALSQAILVGWTHNLSSRMVNEMRVGFNRLNVDFGGNTLGSVPTADAVGTAVSRITFRTPGFLAVGTANNLPQSRIVNTWQAQDNWNFVMGKHTFKAGVNYTFQRSPNVFLPNLNGVFQFQNWGSLLTNTPRTLALAAGDPTLDFREHDTFIYAGDDWKIGQHLTVNLGLTWSYYGQPANLFNQITVPRESNPATALWASTSSPTTTGDPASPINGQAIPLSARTFPTFPAPKNSFGPSVGFAYSPQWGGFLTGNGKTTIRGGYRLLYDPPFYNIYINMSSSAPEVFLQSFSGAAAASKPLPAVPNGTNVRSLYSSFLAKGVFDPRQFADTSLSPDFGPDRVHSWSLGFERELSKNSAVEVRYAGNHALDLFQSVNANPFVADLLTDFPNLVPAGITPCPASQAVVASAVGRVNCNQGIQRNRINGGSSDYNALQTEFRANNLFKQLTIRTGYTFAKTLDNVSEIFATFGGATTVPFAQNPFNTNSGERSFSGLDIPHQWTITATEEIPFFKEQHGFIGHVLGGWVVNANYVLASGQRYTPAQLGDAAFGSNGDYFDANFLIAFNGGGVDQARPFLGNLSAPQTSVGVFCGDLPTVTGISCPAGFTDTSLISMTAIGQTCFNNSNNPATPTTPCNFVNVTNNQVRFIINAATAQGVFGTPFGNTPRNVVQDAISNVANASVLKRFRISEHNSFEFRADFQNVFNHQNFSSVDPFLDDAGQFGSFNGFGDPRTTATAYPGFNGGTRRINFGLTYRF